MLRRDQVPERLMRLLESLSLRKNLPNDYSEKQGDVAASMDEAHAVTSEWAANPGNHMIALDIDVPAWLIPSSTPGHSHLYIQSYLEWGEYEELLRALSKVGILETGYVEASRRRKGTCLRLPWVRKGQEHVSSMVSSVDGIEEFLKPDPEVELLTELGKEVLVDHDPF